MTKLKIHKSCALSTLLYGSECWRITRYDITRLSTFHTKCLRRMLRIFWPNTISNRELFACTHQEDMETVIMRRRFRWLGHDLRKEPDSITRTALHWTPEGKRKRGRPRNTWRRTIETELKDLGHTWGSIQRLAQCRSDWRTFVAALYARKGMMGSK